MELKLNATVREQHGKRVRTLRAHGKLPAVVYGHRTDSTPLLLDTHEFERVFARAGRTHLVDLVTDGSRAQKVLVREVQVNPRRLGPVHVDLYRVDMREKLTAEVPVVLVGESPAAKRGEADLVQMLNHVRVECLPADIPEHLEVDISMLENVGDAVRVKDLRVPDNLTVQTDPEDLLARNQARREVVEEEPVAAEGEELPEAAATDDSAAAEGSEEA